MNDVGGHFRAPQGRHSSIREKAAVASSHRVKLPYMLLSPYLVAFWIELLS